MKIAQLSYFTTIAQLENISRAAELLHVSQSSLSKNIAALETELGTPLFDRSAKQLSLTPAGERFLKSCNSILLEYENLKNDIQLIATGANTRIHIGSCGSIDRLYPCLAKFKELCPEAEYRLKSCVEKEDPPDINAFDVLIYPAEFQFEKFTGYDFGTERYYLAVSASHGLAKSSVISLKMLMGLDFVFQRREGASAEYAHRIYQALAIQGSSQSFVDSPEVHRQMIASGIAAGFVSDSCADFYAAKSIRLIPLLDSRFSRKLRICFKRDKHLTDFGRRFRNFTIQYFSLTE